jgi:hypothetical protein
MVIGIDFDGTCVSHEFPMIGSDIGSVPVLKELVSNGHQLILFTMRSDKKDVYSDHHFIHSKSGKYLTEAINWFKENDIPLYGIQTNPTQKTWTESPKAYCELYIDDSGIGCPLQFDLNISKRPFVDWVEVRKILRKRSII